MVAMINFSDRWRALFIQLCPDNICIKFDACIPNWKILPYTDLIWWAKYGGQKIHFPDIHISFRAGNLCTRRPWILQSFCLFDCSGVFVPFKKFSLICRRYHYWWRAAKFGLCLNLHHRLNLAGSPGLTVADRRPITSPIPCKVLNTRLVTSSTPYIVLSRKPVISSTNYVVLSGSSVTSSAPT